MSAGIFNTKDTKEKRRIPQSFLSLSFVAFVFKNRIAQIAKPPSTWMTCPVM